MTCQKIIKNVIVALLLPMTSIGALGREPIVINDDKSVTITLYAPDVDEVQVQGNFIDRFSLLPMFAKDGKADMDECGDGYWTFTSKPLASELYWYHFIIDEDIVAYDTRNPNTTRDIGTIYNYFVIDGGLADDYVDRPDSKSQLDYVWYPSDVNGMSHRRMAVYLPDGYYESPTRCYPVLYLLHGSGGDETAWADCGRLVQIMDNLISAGRCEPMIVVMPNGNVELAAAPGDDPHKPEKKPSGQNVKSMLGVIESAFVPEVVGFVDKNYRTLADKQHRAIAGLSLGGLHTLFISLNNPETFDYVGLFSAQTTNALNDKRIGGLKQIGDEWERLKHSIPLLDGSKLDRMLSDWTGIPEPDIDVYKDVDGKLKAFFEGDPKLFYMAVGMDDFTRKLNDDLRKKLYNNNYPFVFKESDGGHTWTNWRRYLVDYLPRLFN